MLLYLPTAMDLLKRFQDEASHDNKLSHIEMIINGEFPASVGQACDP